MNSLIAILALFFTPHLSIYCNARFGYCVDYPTTIDPQPESSNGDGRGFKNRAGETVLIVFGRRSVDVDGHPIPLGASYASEVKELLSAKADITYRKLGKDFFVLTGHKEGTLFYEKAVLKQDQLSESPALGFAIVTFAKSEQAGFNELSSLVYHSLR